MADYNYNGSSINSDWVQTTVSQSGETGFHEDGEDWAQKYAYCSNNNCSGTDNPVCQSIPSQYDPIDSVTFWTGNCVSPP